MGDTYINQFLQRFLIVALLIWSVNATTEITCPQDCICTAISSTDPANHLHAKCSSLVGLAQSARTSTIQSVDCSNIQLAKITNQLDKLSNLTHLDASQNNLTEVPRLNRRIRTLNLSFNRITSGKLLRIPLFVNHLNLSHNQLTYLPLSITTLNHLKSIELYGNSIDCNCDTLQVRNWLQLKHIRTDNYVVCATPLSVKGKPWLQVRKSELCETGEDIWNDKDENEIMQSDQAVNEDVSLEKLKDEEEFGKDYLPIEKYVFKRQLNNDTNLNEEDEDEEEELEDGSGDSGSGDSIPLLKMAAIETSTPEEEGSGSDAAVLIVSSSDDPITSTTVYNDEDENPVVPTLGIFQQNVHVHTIDETTPIPKEEIESSDNTDESAKLRIAQAPEPVKNDPLATEDKAEGSTAESTYVLLIILGLLLVGLIVFVVIRRKTQREKNRRDADAENANSKELMVMSKDQLGKPINGNTANNNGGANEILPLIGHRDKWDSRIQPHHGLTKPEQEELLHAHEPLLKKVDEPLQHAAVTKPEPTPRTHRPISNGSGNLPQENNNNNINDTKPEPAAPDQPDIVVDEPPVSPRSPRYSPVYSAETGRVKIKLSETQKPRTPMLVSRTRSNAGDIITTPVHQSPQ